MKNISVEMPKNKITAIIGPSGCGKTTLLKSLNRLIDLNEGVKYTGKIFVDEINIFDIKVDIIAIRKKMGLLPQKPIVLPMSIYDNVAYGPRIHGEKKKKKLDEIVEKYLKLASLWEEVKNRLHAPASGLSIGQQQRLCLARGLAVEPEIILGDEPASALDPISSDIIEKNLLALKNAYTVIIVTHNIQQAVRIADYVIFLYLGNLIEHGPAEQVFKNPRDLKTHRYISGCFIDADFKIDREINLKGEVCPYTFIKSKLALEEMENGQILKVIVDFKEAVEEVPRGMEFEGHKVLEVKQISETDWQLILQKE